MYEKIKNYIEEKDNKIFFKGEGEMVFYIPDVYFESDFATFYGEIVSLLGIFNYAVFKNGKAVTDLLTFKFPSKFMCKPGEIEKVKDLKLIQHSDPDNYHLLKFRDGDEIIVNTYVPQTIDSIEAFLKLYMSGKFPTTIAYDQHQNFFTENMKLNGKTYPCTTQLIGIIIGEFARNQKDLSKPYREGEFNNDKTNYSMINIKDLPKFVSPYTAVTSENWDESLASALVNNDPKDSPLERLFKV